MPTGGGKSITFQVPALAAKGVCIIITPLIALMQDQVEHLKAAGIRAEAIHSGISRNKIISILDNAIFGAVKFLYVSPERLSNELFIAKLAYMKVCFITVDEAHCISQWGYDFRPSYLKINELRSLLPSVPVLALTATATPAVVKDITEKLEFGKHSPADISVAATSATSATISADTSTAVSADTTSAAEGYTPHIYSMSFLRRNITYVVRYVEDKSMELARILRSVNGTAIVYTRNRKNTKEISNELKKLGLNSTYYHAGLDSGIKNQRQRQWQDDEIAIMVATNAFGMGIDKADVRLVIHMDCPDSLEEYYQEAGRAGRDGKQSYAVLLCDNSDRTSFRKRVNNAFPPKEYIRRVYDHICFYFYIGVDSGYGATLEFDIDTFCIKYHHFPTSVESALKILQNAGYLIYQPENDEAARVKIIVEPYQLDNPVLHLTPNESKLLETMLRYYGTLFTDMTYIETSFLCNKCAMTEETFHVTLKSLSQKRVVNYVPRRRIPTITFTRDRVASEHLNIPRAVYEEMQERYVERADKILQYMSQGVDGVCRQRLILDYFGEHLSEDCGTCDVCRARRMAAQGSNGTQEEKARQALLALLSDGKPHNVSELKKLGFSSEVMSVSLKELRDAERLSIDGGDITLIE